MIGFAVVFGVVAIFAWSFYWIDKSVEGPHEGAALFMAALPWLILVACAINIAVGPTDSIDEASEPTYQVED